MYLHFMLVTELQSYFYMPTPHRFVLSGLHCLFVDCDCGCESPGG